MRGRVKFNNDRGTEWPFCLLGICLVSQFVGYVRVGASGFDSVRILDLVSNDD
jgi:hypothetical protein